MLIIGKVQVKDDQVNIIVDKVVTKLENAHKRPLPKIVFSPLPKQWRLRSVLAKQPSNLNRSRLLLPEPPRSTYQ